jgi:urease accessory protein
VPAECRRQRPVVAPILLSLIAAALPAVAGAHPADLMLADGQAGFLHPLTGIDHLLAMLAVGLWAARMGKPAVWVLPAAFPLAMMLGALLSSQGIVLPAVEPVIAVSVVTLGLLMAFGIRAPLLPSTLLIAAFALFHGYAHVLDAPQSGASLAYGAGFVSATVILHLLGVAIGLRLEQRPATIAKLAGSAIAVVGVAFFQNQL